MREKWREKKKWRTKNVSFNYSRSNNVNFLDYFARAITVRRVFVWMRLCLIYIEVRNNNKTKQKHNSKRGLLIFTHRTHFGFDFPDAVCFHFVLFFIVRRRCFLSLHSNKNAHLFIVTFNYHPLWSECGVD